MTGQTLEGFVELLKDCIASSGLKNTSIHTGPNTSQLPGYFRPNKSWDIVVLHDNKVIAAIELKSQIGSIGNNFNNRTEEAVGSGFDLWTAIQEGAFGYDCEIFTGYLILVEESPATLNPTKVSMKWFPVMPGFLQDESQRQTTYKPNPNF